MNATHPNNAQGFAPLFASGLFSSGAVVPAKDLAINTVEAEIAFVLGEDLPPLPRGTSPRTERDVAAAISHVLPALELCGSRLPSDAKPLAKLADFLLNCGVVLGEERMAAPSVSFLR